MARTRLLHPQQTVDEDVNALSIHARYVWAFLPCHADREGRLADKPFSLKLAILPAEAVDMNTLLEELARRLLITRYVADGRKYIQIRTFKQHQHPHRNETASVIPQASANGNSETDHGENGAGNVASTPDPGEVPTGGSGDDPVSGEVTGARVCDPGATGTTTGTVHPLPSGSGSRLTAHDVVHKFGIRWRAKHSEEWAPDRDAYAAARDLLENQIGAMTESSARLHAIEDLPNAMDRYLADPGKDSTLNENKHPFPWFVNRYNKYRFAPAAVTTAGTRPRWVSRP